MDGIEIRVSSPRVDLLDRSKVSLAPWAIGGIDFAAEKRLEPRLEAVVRGPAALAELG